MPLACLQHTENLDDAKCLGYAASPEAPGGILHALLEDSDKVFIAEAAIFLALQSVKGALTGVRICPLLKLHKPIFQVKRSEPAQCLWGTVREDLAEEFVYPFLVSLGDTGMEPVEETKLHANLVTDSPGRAVIIEMLANLHSWIKCP